MSEEELDQSAGGAPEADSAEDHSVADLRAHLELLEAENRQLREEFVRARQSRYRRTALGLALLGGIAVVGGVVFPAARPVLFSLGATGLFGALLTYYLTPERFLAAGVAEGVYDAVARTGGAIVSELGLQDDRLYVPLDRPDRRAALFVPQHADDTIPDADALDATFVVTEEERSRGVAFAPTGDALFREFERSLAGPLADEPARVAEQLADGLREDVELAESVRVEEVGEDALVVALSGSAIDDVTRFDHPVVSFLGVGLAVGLDHAVSIEVHADTDRADVLVRCSWETDRS